MAVELATAYVSLVADTSKLAKSMDSGFSGLSAQLDKKGTAAGAGFIGGLTGGLVGPALQLGGKLVDALATPLTKGFDRLVNLDNATAKLEGLGHSAESVQTIMDSALGAVRGTAFGLDEAAGVAASAVAAGVKPGQELQRTLSLVADASTIAGTSMGDMGSIFNKVAGTGKIQGEVIAQLGERGIPILQLLADEMGVSAEEVGKLAAAGEIDFARFQNAMEAGMGGAALKSGETFQGAMANMQASLGRIGAGFLGPLFEELAPTITALTSAMGPLEGVAATLGEKFGDFLVPVLETFQELLAGGFDFAPFLELAGYLSPIGLAFKVLQPVLPLIMDSLTQIASVVGGALGQVLQALMPVITAVAEIFAQLVAAILPPLLPIIVQLAGIISQVLVAVLPLLDPLMQLITAIFPILQTVIAALIPIIQGVVDAIAAILIPVVNTLVEVLGGVITFLTGVFTGDWDKAWSGVVQIFEGLWNGILDIGKGVINGIIDLINGLTAGLNEVGNFARDVSGGAIDFTIGKIPHLADGATVLPRRGGTLAVLAEAGRAESVVDTGLLNRALAEGIGGSSSGKTVQMDVHPAPGMDEMTIGRIAAERLDYELRGA
ncbi:tape measure protein [Microbacterium sp. NPDC087592]|uniref:tape measure protein n=1 Tax=Microbacterium sp. NPDC087592 TaxID=3364193 RepID=UPI003824A065